MSKVSSEINQEVEDQPTAQLKLPPGFRFHPSDEEIIMQYLMPKSLDRRFTSGVINEVDLNKSEPRDLSAPAVRGKMREQEWYFSSKDKDRKCPRGTRTSRAMESGNWRATRKDKEFVRGRRGKKDNKC